MHCSLIMHGFHNGKWFILCSNVSLVYKYTFVNNKRDSKKLYFFSRNFHLASFYLFNRGGRRSVRLVRPFENNLDQTIKLLARPKF